MQHAAESRWQPGRSGGGWGKWGEGGSGGGGGGKPWAGVEDMSAWHMWLAAGVGAEGPGGRMTGGCDCAGGGRCGGVGVWGGG